MGQSQKDALMQRILWLDLETYSAMPITHGVYRYAETAEILLIAYALDEAQVTCWDKTAHTVMPDDLSAALADPGILVCAHNSNFDRTILRAVHPDCCPPVERWCDTMVRALLHGLPGALDLLCPLLGVAQAQHKLKTGAQLIQLFCKPRPKTAKCQRADRTTHPDEWQRFIDYAKQDIEALRAIHKKLPAWNDQETEQALWHLDQRINDRGIQVDTCLAEAAIIAVEQAQHGLAQQTQTLTNGAVQAATQRDALLKHILEAHGVSLPDMQAATLERRVNDPDLPAAVRELLAVRLQASGTSTSKYQSLLRSVSCDGRLRGTLQFSGAARTRRWAGRRFQPQNLPRPKLKQDAINFGIKALKAQCADLLCRDVMLLTSSALRGCLIAPPGKKLVVADLANIEGRAQAWLAGENWKIQAFKDFDAGTGHDLYRLAYAKAFHCAPENVSDAQRQIGKVLELALGYGGGVGAFLTFAAAYGLDLDALAEQTHLPASLQAEAQAAWEWAKQQKRTFGLSQRAYITCDAIKRAWRSAHPAISRYWKMLEDTAREAICAPGNTLSCGSLKCRREGTWLRIGLPSRRALCYPGPEFDEQGALSYKGMHPYTRQWQRLSTYGGKLFENASQSLARDVLADRLAPIETAGYPIVLTVHDEVICETPDTPQFNPEHLSSLLATPPEWATGLPLAAKGFEATRYRKD
jgi:DNA polymerase bacteriophage-type